MEVWDWWPFIRRRIKTILWIDVLTVAVAMGITFVLPPVYRSTAILSIQPLAEDQVLAFPSASQMVARNAGELIKSPGVTERAAKKLGVPELTGELDYRVPEDGSLIEVIADAGSPQGAADEANAVASAFVEYNTAQAKKSIQAAQATLVGQIADLREQIAAKQGELADARAKSAGTAVINGLQDELDALQTGYEGVLQRWQSLPAAETLLSTSVSLVDEALPDPEPVGPRPVLNLLLAVAGGLLLGVGVASATEKSVAERRSGD